MVRKHYLFLLALMLFSATAATSAEVTCAFNIEASKKGIIKLNDHRYRVRRDGAREVLEQQFADRSWGLLGSVSHQVAGEYSVYLHLPEAGQDDFIGAVRLLTIYQDGRASLLQDASHTGPRLGGAYTSYGLCWPST